MTHTNITPCVTTVSHSVAITVLCMHAQYGISTTGTHKWQESFTLQVNKLRDEAKTPFYVGQRLCASFVSLKHAARLLVVLLMKMHV